MKNISLSDSLVGLVYVSILAGLILAFSNPTHRAHRPADAPAITASR